LVAEVP